MPIAHDSLVSSFWEEHCCECAMPLCYRTCGMFDEGWHGRCLRIDGFEESVRGVGSVSLRRWGKLEAVYHGTLISPRGARCLERINLSLRPLWKLLGARHRAVRWRLAALCGKKGVPNVWKLEIKAERNENLVASIAYEDGREIFREHIALKAGEKSSLKWRLPPVEKKALFRIFASNGEATGVMDITLNTVGRDTSEEQPLKCVVWDLDGVLWDGTLSEGDDVKLRDGIVDVIRELDASGVVNSIASKNDESVALAKLKDLGIEEYFVFPQINWGPKSESVKHLSQEMNISPDSIAFVDDREENRAEVRAHLPSVRIFDENSYREILKLISTNHAMGCERRLSYRAEMERRKDIKDSFGGNEKEFLRNSGIEMELLPVEGDRVARCLELVCRTNQLNLTAKRYDAADFAELLEKCETRAVRVWDKYGDYGIVGFVAWDDTKVLELVFSCRVAKKGVERRVLDSLPRGLSITAVVTDRNAPIREIVNAWTEERK